MSAIDHTSYPYIMDSIIAHAPMQALFKLRLTSKAFSERIDTFVGHHVLLEASDTSNPETTVCLPTMYRFTPGPHRWVLHTTPNTVRTLDVNFKEQSETDINDVLRPFTSLTTVRQMHPQHATNAFMWLPSGTVVDFVPISRSFLNHSIKLCPARRHIIHLGVCDPMAEHALPVIEPQGPLNDIVVVVWPSSCNNYVLLDEFTQAFVTRALCKIVKHRPRSLTIIGLERILSSAPAWWHPPLAPIMDIYWRTMDLTLNAIIGVDRMDIRLTFLTVEDWWEELDNDGEREVVGVWPTECGHVSHRGCPARYADGCRSLILMEIVSEPPCESEVPTTTTLWMVFSAR